MSGFGEFAPKLAGVANYNYVNDAYLSSAPNLAIVGTITTGVWNATNIGLAFGGLNASLTASSGGIVYCTSTGGAILAGTATANQAIFSGALSAPFWSSTVWPVTTTINQILYSSANNVVTGLATATTAVLTTNSSGVPALVNASNTYVPTITGSVANPSSVTYSSQLGFYIQIGPMVFFAFNITLSALTIGSASGNLQISLPIANGANIASTIPVKYAQLTTGSSFNNMTGNMAASASVMTLVESVNAAANVTVAITALTSSTQLNGTGFYFTN